MATCSRCKQHIDDTAAACPHCQTPVVVAFHVDLSSGHTTMTEEAPKPKKTTRVQWTVLGLLGATFATILMIYFVLMPFIEKENAARVQPPPPPIVLPWADRAMDLAQKSFKTEAIAAPIVETLYGKPASAVVDKLEVSREGNDIVTVFTISWEKPGEEGNHILQVSWRCNEEQHVGVEVSKTDQPAPKAEALEKLDKMIAGQLYGAMRRVQ